MTLRLYRVEHQTMRRAIVQQGVGHMMANGQEIEKGTLSGHRKESKRPFGFTGPQSNGQCDDESVSEELDEGWSPDDLV